MHPETFQLELEPSVYSAIHRFRSEKSTIPVLLIHGSMESARIFYSKSGKGFAPFLAKRGFDVFAVDIIGKGQSLPKVNKSLKHSQSDFIHRDMARYLEHIQKYYPNTPVRIGGHSWGGVLALAWYAYYGNLQNTGSMVFFGSKRRIGVFHPKRIFMVDLMWSVMGYTLGTLLGYFPTGKLRMGVEDESLLFFKETNQWVYGKKWIDRETGKDIASMLKNKALPPVLYFSAVNDDVLGNPLDVERLKNETGSKNSELILLGKINGNLKDYGHNDMLTSKSAPDDHFKLAVNWFLKD